VAVDAFLLALALALLLGGRFRNLGRLDIRGAWLGVILFALLAGATALAYAGVRPALTKWLFVGGNGLLAALLLRNWRVPGLALAGLGLVLNFAVTVANGGLMPVDPATLAHLPPQYAALFTQHAGEELRHALMAPGTSLVPLADRYVFPFSLLPPYPQPYVFSVGDFVMSIGIVWAVLVGMGVPWLTRGMHVDRTPIR